MAFQSGLGLKRVTLEEKESSTTWRKTVMIKWPEAQRGAGPTSVLTVRHDSREEGEEKVAEPLLGCTLRNCKALNYQDG